MSPVCPPLDQGYLSRTVASLLTELPFPCINPIGQVLYSLKDHGSQKNITINYLESVLETEN